MGIKWTTKDGRKLEISEMHSAHLRNCIAMIRRQGFCSTKEFWNAVSFASSLGGEFAREAAGEEICKMNPTIVIDVLEQELARRDDNG